ncbi:MAG: peptidase domain protein [Segetibacter sp.]|nr:peptidase domain protein [Segetibacter sp.]
MKKLLLQTILFGLLTVPAFAQKNNFWAVNNQSRSNIVTDKATLRQSYPTDLKLFNLNLEPFRQELFSIVDRSSKKSAIISLPNAAGEIEDFEVFEASNFEPVLQARFPDIRSYSGKGVTDKSATLKLSISPQGIQTMVFRTEKDNEFIEPYSKDHTIYSVYTSNREKGKLPWNCTTVDTKMAEGLNGRVADANLVARSTGDLKSMRLAQSVTAEYSNYFGATSSSQVSLVLAAINNTLARCNGVYEKDLALHLNLVAASANVIYYNPSTDPYSPASSGAGGAWNGELQSTLTSVVGETNYDIGHLFGASGGGGNAGCIGCVCTNGSKGSGYTSPADGIPQGDNFDVDYVVHEVGHQLGANHTFSMSNEGTGVNKEVGSGITIMGYAGITNQDIAPHSFDIYHQASIAQIQANLATKTCPVTTAISNATPAILALTNYTIPKSTPFALTGSATDGNAGDVLTYSWEQNDNAPSTQTGASSVASATKASGPNWTTFRPTTFPTRYFPQLSSILAGALVTGPLPGGDPGTNIEALSSVARTLNFRLTVRDNAPYNSTAPVTVGQTNFRDMIVTVSAASGPFSVSAPNTAVSWAGGSARTITWAVASTTAAPVSCANVKISLSTDGGQSFPTILAASTPNDGTEVLTIPNTPTTTARIKVEAVGNIFFDISNTNFNITSGSSCSAPAGLTSSAITTNSATVSWTPVTDAVSYDVDYKVTSSATWTNTATATTSTSVNFSGLTASTVYDYRVRTNCSGASGAYTAAQFTTAGATVCNAPSGLASSAITTTSATVSWTAVSGAASYAVDYKLTSSATWTSAATATTTTSVSLTGLTASSAYDWRVRTNCSGGSSGYTAAQFTTSTVSGCATAFEPNETQATAAAITSGVTNSAAIGSSTDIDYFKITTTATSNIIYNLVGPSAMDYDLYVYNSSGTQIGAGETGTATETVSLSGQAAGTYYIKVVGYNGANSVTCYTIKATASTATACQSTVDNSTNGTISGAATIPFNTNVNGRISPSGDVDNYKFAITTAGTITVTLGTLPADYDLRLLNSAGTQVGISQNGGTTSETISYTAAPGTYYAQVIGYNGANSSTVCYTLKVQLGTATRGGAEAAKVPIVSIYPNPVRGELKVNMGSNSETVSVTVTDMYGRRMMNKTFTGVTTLSTSKFAAGVYMITITDKHGAIIKQDKIVKE